MAENVWHGAHPVKSLTFAPLNASSSSCAVTSETDFKRNFALLFAVNAYSQFFLVIDAKPTVYSCFLFQGRASILRPRKISLSLLFSPLLSSLMVPAFAGLYCLPVKRIYLWRDDLWRRLAPMGSLRFGLWSLADSIASPD